jgi:hypothetical protein
LVLKHVGEASLAGHAQSKAGETFWLGIILSAPLAKNERDALEAVGSLFTLVVEFTEPREKAPISEVDQPHLHLADATFTGGRS